jgi:hypothetical protein
MAARSIGLCGHLFGEDIFPAALLSIRMAVPDRKVKAEVYVDLRPKETTGEKRT